jgi:hypothetical protein
MLFRSEQNLQEIRERFREVLWRVFAASFSRHNTDWEWKNTRLEEEHENFLEKKVKTLLNLLWPPEAARDPLIFFNSKSLKGLYHEMDWAMGMNK